MKKSIFIIAVLLISSIARGEKQKELSFGVIATVKPEIVHKHFKPLLDYLSEKTGLKINFATGVNYDDTIKKFVDGTFDLGYIGPAPYVLATRQSPGSLRVIAGIETDNRPTFNAVIVVRRDSNIASLGQLAGNRFAFGSRRSTLSYYLPYYMLMKEGVIEKLEHCDFLGRHDIVAKNVIMGNYDAGGIKMSVANTYKNFLKNIAVSEPVTDFAIVVHRDMDPALAEKIKEILLNLKDPKILEPIKKRMTGFGPRKDSDYNRLREIMKIVEEHTGYRD